MEATGRQFMNDKSQRQEYVEDHYLTQANGNSEPPTVASKQYTTHLAYDECSSNENRLIQAQKFNSYNEPLMATVDLSEVTVSKRKGSNFQLPNQDTFTLPHYRPRSINSTTPLEPYASKQSSTALTQIDRGQAYTLQDSIANNDNRNSVSSNLRRLKDMSNNTGMSFPTSDKMMLQMHKDKSFSSLGDANLRKRLVEPALQDYYGCLLKEPESYIYQSRVIEPSTYENPEPPQETLSPLPSRLTVNFKNKSDVDTSLSLNSNIDNGSNHSDSFNNIDIEEEQLSIEALRLTTIGHWMWKYTRKIMGNGFSGKKHRRYLWVQPYTRSIYWSTVKPTGISNSQRNTKSGKKKTLI
ncbi:MAG: hypothetical protein EXX96DRAFT_27400 [Benjaminiella poitrasii]|nr:MAG: hypothetical protein EXX96DRAFT_27400 [Benjaminiella poitrasii]